MGASLATSLANFILIIYSEKSVPVLQSYVLEAVALGSALALTYFNHTRSRTSSTVLLLFWPAYLAGLAVWIRTVIIDDFEHLRPVLVLKCVVMAFGLSSFVLECIGPEYDSHVQADGDTPTEHPIATANVFSIWVS